jgi:hypothetical protein
MSDRCCDKFNPHKLRAEAYGKLAEWASQQKMCYDQAAAMEEQCHGIKENIANEARNNHPPE